MAKRFDVTAVVETSDEFDGADVRYSLTHGASDIRILKVETCQQQYSELRFTHKALARQALAVAVPGEADDWAVYIDAVPGHNHAQEAPEVARHGCKQTKEMAVKLFPQFDPAKYRR
jgi:hypothetical protein